MNQVSPLRGSGIGSSVSRMNQKAHVSASGSLYSVDSIDTPGPCPSVVIAVNPSDLTSFRTMAGHHSMRKMVPVMGCVAILTPPAWRSSSTCPW